MSVTTIQPIESKTVSPPTQKDNNDSQLVKNIFSCQMEVMVKKMANQFNLPVEDMMKMVNSHSISVDVLDLVKKKRN